MERGRGPEGEAIHVRTFDDLQAREVDLDKAGLDGTAIRTIQVSQPESTLNLTP